ncbi:uncharacterized protein PAC_05447 [Phialocephala subalpina]|uniref:SnoaL-like domain-containing protein n=1 Tax=Phialocephala subalpina TaxID=576137 RepID=A0A1L7WS19_9HELO|nr:uncharacterized protein PAC_05447 [Phialocephala subalpina]
MSAQTLEEKLVKLTLVLERQDAFAHIQNLVSRMAYLWEAGLYEERLEYVAKKTEGVTIEIGGRGVYEGYEGAKRCLVDIERSFEKSHAAGMRRLFPAVKFGSDHAGLFESEVMGTPVIEVAGDGKTAKGVWTTLQAGGKTHEHDPKPQSSWIWWRLAIDFVKEDGQWKVWHLLKNPFFFCPSNGDWVELSQTLPPVPKPGTQKGIPGHNSTPDRATTKLYDPYRINREPRLWPEPPRPYETFDPKDAYCG